MDERARVRDALVRLVADGHWPGPDRDRTTNQLLDLCGSDARPAATLLITYAEHAARALEASPTLGWAARRAAAVASLTHQGVPIVDAGWIIDAWAYARGDIGSAAVVTERAHAAPPAPLRIAPPAPAARRAWGRGAASGGPARWRGGTPVTALPRWSRTDRIAGAIGALMFLAVTVAAWRGIGGSAESRHLTETVAASRRVAAAPDAAASDGQLARPVASSLAVPERRVAEPAFASPGPDARLAPPLLVRGVGGRYLVWRALVSVSGDGGCETLDRSIDWQRPIDEVVVHEPGHTRIAFMGRRTLRGEMGWDGGFVVGPVLSEVDGGASRVTMRGRFSDDSFEAESETVSRVLLGWRQWRTCRVVVTLRGVRRAGEAPR